MSDGILRGTIPGPWFVAAMIGAAALLGFYANGFGDFTAWSMAVIALVAIFLPYFT